MSQSSDSSSSPLTNTSPIFSTSPNLFTSELSLLATPCLLLLILILFFCLSVRRSLYNVYMMVSLHLSRLVLLRVDCPEVYEENWYNAGMRKLFLKQECEDHTESPTVRVNYLDSLFVRFLGVELEERISRGESSGGGGEMEPHLHSSDSKNSKEGGVHQGWNKQHRNEEDTTASSLLDENVGKSVQPADASTLHNRHTPSSSSTAPSSHHSTVRRQYRLKVRILCNHNCAANNSSNSTSTTRPPSVIKIGAYWNLNEDGFNVTVIHNQKLLRKPLVKPMILHAPANASLQQVIEYKTNWVEEDLLTCFPTDGQERIVRKLPSGELKLIKSQQRSDSRNGTTTQEDTTAAIVPEAIRSRPVSPLANPQHNMRNLRIPLVIYCRRLDGEANEDNLLGDDSTVAPLGAAASMKPSHRADHAYCVVQFKRKLRSVTPEQSLFTPIPQFTPEIYKTLYQNEKLEPFVVSEVYTSEDDDCVICLSEEPSVILLPCRHQCVCFDCFSQIDRCPTCRSNIELFIFSAKRNSTSQELLHDE